MDDDGDPLDERLRALARDRVLPPAADVRQRGALLRRRNRRRKLAVLGAAVTCIALVVPLMIVNQDDRPPKRIDTVAPVTSTDSPAAVPQVPTPTIGSDGTTAQCTGDLPVTIDTAYGFSGKLVSGPTIIKGVTTATWEMSERVRVDAYWPGSMVAQPASTERIAGRRVSTPIVDADGPTRLLVLTDEQVAGPCATIEFTAKADHFALIAQAWPMLLDNLAGPFHVTPASGAVGTQFTVVGAPSRASLSDGITPALQQGRGVDVYWWNAGAFTGAEAQAEIFAMIGAATFDERGWLRFAGSVPAQLNRVRSSDGNDGTIDIRSGRYELGFGHRLDRRPGASFTVRTAFVPAPGPENLASAASTARGRELLGDRDGYSQTWTGKELVVMGGRRANDVFGDGAAYDPRRDTWRAIAPAPHVRSHHFAVWSGAEIIVGGGSDDSVDAYDPTTDRWRELGKPPFSIAGVPEGKTILNPPQAILPNALTLVVWIPKDRRIAVMNLIRGSWDSVVAADLPSSPSNRPAKLYWTGSEALVVVEQPASAVQSTLVGVRIDPARLTVRALSPLQLSTPGFLLDARPTSTLWNLRGLVAWAPNGDEPLAYELDLALNKWSPVPGPVLAPCESHPNAIPVGRDFLVVSGCGVDAALYNSVDRTWQSLNNFRDLQSAWPGNDVAWTGQELIRWTSSYSEAGFPSPGPTFLWIKRDPRLG